MQTGTGALTALFVALMLSLVQRRALGLGLRKGYGLRRITRLNSSESANGYLSVHVTGKITNEGLHTFYTESLENAKNSIQESGIARFDVLSSLDDPSKFMLIEVYRTAEGPGEHKDTKHYNSWREAVAPFMEEPRQAAKYSTIYPPTWNWKTDTAAAKAMPAVTPTFYKDAPFSVLECNGGNVNNMLAVVVDIEVLQEHREAFIDATITNCKNSLKEPGVQRFDFMQNKEDPNRFALVEVYNAETAPPAHKATAHYSKWAATVAPMMARPRASSKYSTLFPAPLFWHRSSFVTHSAKAGGSDTNTAETGDRGLSHVSGSAFGFIGPKISMGRGIAGKAITGAVKDLTISKPFVVTGKSGLLRHKDLLRDSLEDAFDESAAYAVGSEPTVEDVVAAKAKAKEIGCDGVIAIGGGSAVDVGKVLAAVLTNNDDIFNYLEVIGKGMPIQNKPLPFIAIPTTSGTGAEATKNGVLKSLEHGRKVSMRADSMIPAVAIVDPLLTVSCPPEITAHVGLDTLCQVIEPFVSVAANPFIDALAREGILRASRSLRAAVANGEDIEAREDMAIASVMGGLCLANAKLGAVHGYAGVLGGMFETAPHGAICAALMPAVMRENVARLEAEAASGDATANMRLDRFVEVARIVTGMPDASAAEGVLWVEALVRDLRVPSISALCGLKEDQIDDVVTATMGSSSTKGNPVVLTAEELKRCLMAAF